MFENFSPSIFQVDYVITEDDIISNDAKPSEDNERLIEPDPIKNPILKFLSFIFTTFIFTSTSILFWASSWDMVYLYLLPKHVIISYLVSLVLAKAILFLCSFYQDSFHSFGEYLKASSAKTGFLSYVNWFILYKIIYVYFITWGYILQWRTYWDAYNKLTEDYNYWYFVALSFFGYLVYRYVFKQKIIPQIEALPFQLTPDCQYDSLFKQSSAFKFKKKWIEKALNFLYTDTIEMIIQAVLWKGCYDLAERGLENLFTYLLENNTNATNHNFDNNITNTYSNTTINSTVKYNYLNPNELSLITNGIIGYGLFFIIVLLKKNFRKVLKFWRTIFKSKKGEIFLIDFIDYISYWSLVLIWRIIWGVYDNILFESFYPIKITLLTHSTTFLISCMFGVTSTLFGPDGGDQEETETIGVKFDTDKNELSFDTSVYITSSKDS